MRPPRLAAVVERRLLINYRADPDVVAPLLPDRLRPQLVDGAAVVGVCFMRLGRLRPLGWPSVVSLSSESAAHRIAVEWDSGGSDSGGSDSGGSDGGGSDGGGSDGGGWDGAEGSRRGVYIPRRDSAARLSVTAGGRLFPGVHHRADFDVAETDDSFRVAFVAHDGSASAAVAATLSPTLGGRLFSGAEEASAFFQAGSVGFSPQREGCGLEGVELRTDRWAIEPVRVDHAESSFFADPERFPPGSVELDCGLVMRQVPVTWAPVGAFNPKQPSLVERPSSRQEAGTC